ncbi:MAG TPA: M48 family metallopeptidase [Albitalea sp.]
MERQRLAGLRPQNYEHPLDTKALDALQETCGLDTLVRKLNEWGFERLLRVQLTGSYLRVGPDSFPQIHEMVVEGCRVLDLPKRPEVYIAAGGDINAFTAGVERTLVVINAGAVDQLTDDELFFVIAHELGHIKSGHVLYYQIAEFMPLIGQMVGTATFGIGELLGAGLQVALTHWRRTSEFTADRAGLLACQDIEVAWSTLIKLAGLPARYRDRANSADFLEQARQFEALGNDALGWVARALAGVGQTHPWTVLRAKHLLEWVEAGAYERVLAAPADAPLQLPAGVTLFCTQCGRGLAGHELFCTGCGMRVPRAEALVRQ